MKPKRAPEASWLPARAALTVISRAMKDARRKVAMLFFFPSVRRSLLLDRLVPVRRDARRRRLERRLRLLALGDRAHRLRVRGHHATVRVEELHHHAVRARSCRLLLQRQR